MLVLKFLRDMKRLLLLLFWACTAFVFSNFLFAYDGVFTGEEELSVVKSQWFDIIYQQSSERAAGILFEKADSLYQDIASDYGIEPQFRMPLVITSAVEDFNAYWTSYPYNHIVIYDTGAIDDLKVFSETLLSTFRHELTHAVTYNLRSPFLQKVDKIFGDPVNPAPLIITSGWAEGATLTNESKNGEGRLNDEYAMHIVKQAKIEGLFPHYSDIQGASDLYPFGAFYYFNGAFADYLQKTYGMEKYARFWYLCVNFGGLTAKGIFKKAFGLNLYEAWADFEAAYQVPELREIQQEDVCDNNSGAVYSSLTASERGIAFIEKKSSSVYFIDRKDLKDEKKIRKLFYEPDLNDIKFSADGNFLIADLVRENKAVAKKSIDIYFFDSTSSSPANFGCFQMKENGIQDGCILFWDGNYYLVCQKFVSQFNSIKIFKLNLDKNGSNSRRVISASELLKKDFPLDVIPYSFTDIGGGNFAFIKKEGMNYSICLCDLQGNIYREYPAPEDGMVMRHLSFDGKELLFSWTKKSTLPRLGRLIFNTPLDSLFNSSLETGKGLFLLQDYDISGGLFWPLAFAESGDELFYIASFFRQNKLFSGQIECDKSCIVGELSVAKTVDEITDSAEPKFTPQKYNPFDYYSRGLLIPLGLVKTQSFNPEAETSYSLPWGITYITANPWTKGMLNFSAGYGFNTNSVAVETSFSSGTDTSLFNYAVTATAEFDNHFWKQSSLDFTINSVLQAGKISYIVFSNDAFIHYGRSNKAVSENEKFSIGYLASDDLSKYLYANDTFSITYTNVHKSGSNRYEKIGIKASVLCSYILNAKEIPFSEIYQNGGQAGFYSSVYIPKLIPVDSPFRYTFSLPSKISFYLFSVQNKVYSLVENNLSFNVSNFSTRNLPTYNAAYLQTESILFAYDIQRAIPGLRALFANDFNCSFLYTGGFSCPEDLYEKNWKLFYLSEYFDRIKSAEMEYSYYLSLKAALGLTPNIGGLASYSNKMMIFAQLSWLSSNKFVFDCGLDVSF